MSRKDIIIFGATGYTGQFVVRELANVYRRENISWAVAGRSKNKLVDVLKSISKETGIDLNSIETIIVDVDNSESVKNMCDNARLIINCVGPYRFFGEQIIKQCVLSKTHHLDVSGEPEYLERMQLNYNQKALENEIFIVGSCGFDSVPADMGLVFTKNNFKGDLNHVESFLTIDFGNGPATFNYGTWESAVYGFASSSNLGRIRKELFPTRLPKPNYPAPNRTNLFGYFYDNTIKRYCMNFMGSDKSVVQRTQYFNYEILDQRPIQYKPYFTISNWFYTTVMIIWGLSFSVLANYNLGRRLLLKHYKFFSFGLASKKDTTIEQMKDTRFKMEFKGTGFSSRKANKNEQFFEAPNRVIVTEISGPEPGYVSTSNIIVNCALVILREADKIPVKGGVLTPGAAFCNTSLIERLEQDGFSFKVIRNDSDPKASL